MLTHSTFSSFFTHHLFCNIAMLIMPTANILKCIICFVGLLDFDKEKVAAHDTILKFTYGDEDSTGPQNWNKGRVINGKTVPYVLDKRYTKNHCNELEHWISPLNIQTENAYIREYHHKGEVLESIHQDIEHEGVGETIVISVVAENLEMNDWYLGHPLDSYHGIEVRANKLSLLQLSDTFDPLPNTDPFTTFDFHFLSVFYCDLNTAPAYRSMHQLDNKKFPLELDFVFFRKQKEIGMDRNVLSDSAQLEEIIKDNVDEGNGVPENIGVIVAVLGQIGEEDNKYFQHLVEAVKEFHGTDFGVDAMDESENNVVKINTPWSPTWLLPDSSGYFYYSDGSFPVPPCWKVSRYYLMKEPINISQAQLNVLTNIRSDREMGGKMPCTFSSLKKDKPSQEITLNREDYVVKGNDHKPRSEKEILEKVERRKKMVNVRKRLAGEAVYYDTAASSIFSISILMMTFSMLIIFYGNNN